MAEGGRQGEDAAHAGSRGWGWKTITSGLSPLGQCISAWNEGRGRLRHCIANSKNRNTACPLHPRPQARGRMSLSWCGMRAARARASKAGSSRKGTSFMCTPALRPMWARPRIRVCTGERSERGIGFGRGCLCSRPVCTFLGQEPASRRVL